MKRVRLIHLEVAGRLFVLARHPSTAIVEETPTTAGQEALVTVEAMASRAMASRATRAFLRWGWEGGPHLVQMTYSSSERDSGGSSYGQHKQEG